MHENGIQTIKISKLEVETEHMKLMERFGRGEAARRSSMAAAATGKDGVSGRRERMMSHKRRRGEERSVEDVEEDCMVLSRMASSTGIRRRCQRKQDQALMVIGGVRVPRKTRSALTKGSHENGVVKDQILQEEKVEARKKMKPTGSENRAAKLSKMCSGSVEEDIENEMAEVLFGLKKQSQSSTDADRVKSSMSNLADEDKDIYSSREDPKISTSEQESRHDSDPKLKNESDEVESRKHSKEVASMPSKEPKAEGVAGSIELHQEEAKPFVEESVGQEVPQLESKRTEDKIEFDLMAPPRTPPIDDSASDNVAASVVETLQEKKIEVNSEKLNESRSQDDGTKLQQQAKVIIPRLDWQSRLTLQSGSYPLSQRPKRCSTHHYIARNIYLHQKATKTSSLSPPAAVPAPIRDTKQGIVPGNESLASLVCHHAEESIDESSEAMDIEALKRKKLASQQSVSKPASAGNIVHGSTFKFSVGKNHATVAETSNPYGPPKHKGLTNNSSHFLNHSTLPTVAAETRGSPNVTFQERPQLNEYSFPATTPSGTTLTFQGGSSTQAVPLVNGHHYPKLHHQQPHSQAHEVRSSHQKNTGMSADSSSSHRQLESQQLRKTQVISTQSWQSQKMYATQSLQPCKLENDINGGQTASSFHAQHSVYGYGQNYAVPFKPVNFTLMPYSTLSSGSSGNHIEQSQQYDLKGVFGISFGSISGNKSTGTLLNFSSVPQKQATYQNLPTTQSVHQKLHQVSERKTESVSNNPDHDGSKPFTGRTSSTVVKTRVFDKSPSNLNFTASDSHQQRLFQFELQQQQRLARSKTPNITHIFPQALMQNNTSIESPSDSRRSSISQAPVTKSTVDSFLEQQGRASQGQTQISFASNHTSSLVVSVSQGQQTNPSLLTT